MAENQPTHVKSLIPIFFRHPVCFYIKKTVTFVYLRKTQGIAAAEAAAGQTLVFIPLRLQGHTLKELDQVQFHQHIKLY